MTMNKNQIVKLTSTEDRTFSFSFSAFVGMFNFIGSKKNIIGLSFFKVRN